MVRRFDKDLNTYAELIVKVGLNVQSGQRLLIIAPILTPSLVRLIATHAYKAGARLVDVLWSDQELQLIRLQHAPRDSFAEHSMWSANASVEFASRGDALLYISAHDPELLSGQDAEAITTMQRVDAEISEPFMNYLDRNGMNWCVVAAPIAAWAAKVFPSLSAEEQEAKLWEALFQTCRVYEADPVAAWQRHVTQLAARSDYLNQKHYTALRYTAPGTELSVGLPRGHVWHSGQSISTQGISFTPNVPTEEVFTMPHKDRVEGVVTATKPLNYGGMLIENFRLTFAEGRVVDVAAERGEEILRKLVATDEGAKQLGEVALVPHSSPISQSGLLFYNTLFDENASSHLALGRTYRFSLTDGEEMEEDAFLAAGGNHSLVHVDFMIGSNAMNVDGVTDEGTIEPVMRRGEWAFEV